MARAIRELDRSATAADTPEAWPFALRAAIDTMLGCAFPATLQWGPELLLFYNDAYIPMIGERHPAALGRPILETFPEIAETYRPIANKVLAGESLSLVRQPFRYALNRAVEERWFDLSYSPVYAESGNVGGLLAIGVDVTEGVIADRERAVAQARLRRVQETDAVGLIFFDYTGTIIDSSDVFLKTLGYSREDIAGRKLNWRVLTPPEWVAISEQQMERFAIEGRIGPYEKQYFCKDGSRRWMAFAGRDLGDGTIAEYCIDVTDRHAAEEASQAAEQRFRALVEATSDFVYSMSPDWSEMYQLRGRDFLRGTAEPDRNWMETYIHPEDREMVARSVAEAIRNRHTFVMEHRVLRADGSSGWTLSRAVPLTNEQGEVTAWFGAASDITARKQAEEALVRSEKLATLGRLAAAIAHEINNPLESLTNLLYLIQGSQALPADAREYVRAADRELQRVAQIARQSLGFYRENSAPGPSDVGQLLEEAADLLRGKLAAKDVQLQKELLGDLTVTAVSGELRQVFCNLLSNSLDALPHAGAIRIRATRRRDQRRQDREYVVVTIADGGRGIDANVRARIFDPFFTTKGNQGTGLGLWVTHQLVAKHGGRIRVRSRSRGSKTGTAFSLSIPV